MLAHSPLIGEFIGTAGDLVLKTRSHDAFVGVCEGCQEVGSRLAGRTFETHGGKVLCRFACWAEEDLAAFVEEEDLVKLLWMIVRLLLGARVEGILASYAAWLA